MDRILLILLSVLLLACKTVPSEHISSVDMQTPALDLQSALATTDETGRIGNLIMLLRPQLGVESLREGKRHNTKIANSDSWILFWSSMVD
jgi:hypothetical protein